MTLPAELDHWQADLSAFLAYLKHERGYSDKTLSSYQLQLSAVASVILFLSIRLATSRHNDCLVCSEFDSITCALFMFNN